MKVHYDLGIGSMLPSDKSERNDMSLLFIVQVYYEKLENYYEII